MKITKLLYIAILAIGLLSSCAFTASNMTHGGFYIAGIDYLYCSSEKTCLHEQAHQFDAQHGFISSSIDYQVTVTTYAMTNPNGLWSHEIVNYQGSWSEMYAQIYESSGGNVALIPAELQRFYR
jgi:hypothetical protein